MRQQIVQLVRQVDGAVNELATLLLAIAAALEGGLERAERPNGAYGGVPICG